MRSSLVMLSPILCLPDDDDPASERRILVDPISVDSAWFLLMECKYFSKQIFFTTSMRVPEEYSGACAIRHAHVLKTIHSAQTPLPLPCGSSDLKASR